MRLHLKSAIAMIRLYLKQLGFHVLVEVRRYLPSGYWLTILHRRATRPLSCTSVPTPSRIRIWVNPTSWVLRELLICNHRLPTDLDILKLGVLWQPNEAIKQAKRMNVMTKHTHSSNDLTTRKIVTIISTAAYPSSHNLFNCVMAFSILPFWQYLTRSWTIKGCGWSHTLKTLSLFTNPKPEWVDWRLLIACRISPSHVKIKAFSPSSLYWT